MQQHQLTERTRTNATAFSRDLRDYTKTGYATDNQEFHDAINGFASGVRDSTDIVVAALSITQLGTTVSRVEQQRIGHQVRDAAEQISENLKYGKTGQRP